MESLFFLDFHIFLGRHLGQSGFVSKVFLIEEVLPWAIGRKNTLCIFMSILGVTAGFQFLIFFAKLLLFHLIISALCLAKGRKGQNSRAVVTLLNGWLRSGPKC
jgi:hypothetical protein